MPLATLQIVTSPRSTWITAPDAGNAATIRSLLAGRFDEVRRDGRSDPLAVDVGVGIDAYEAGEILIAAGYSFRWHADRHKLNRHGAPWGLPVKGE